jgi:glycosyltransferase involved in cell wall biosynthesis
MNPLVSIFLPTRNRINRFKIAIDSIFNTYDKNNLNFEVIIKVDFDDLETLDYIKSQQSNFENIKYIISSRKNGYSSINEFQKDCGNLARGKYFMFFNDDAEFLTLNWNNILDNKLKDFRFYYPWNNGYKESFPIIPRNIIDILGHYSPHAQTDTYIKWLGQVLGINEYINEIETWQDLDLTDTLSKEKDNQKSINLTNRDFHRTSQVFKNDIRKLQSYLNIDVLNPITEL